MQIIVFCLKNKMTARCCMTCIYIHTFMNTIEGKLVEDWKKGKDISA